MKKLRNDYSRQLYIENPENWTTLKDYGLVRIILLKETKIVKIQLKTADAPGLFTGYQDIATRELVSNDKELSVMVFPLNDKTIIQYLKDIKF